MLSASLIALGIAIKDVSRLYRTTCTEWTRKGQARNSSVSHSSTLLGEEEEAAGWTGGGSFLPLSFMVVIVVGPHCGLRLCPLQPHMDSLVPRPRG